MSVSIFVILIISSFIYCVDITPPIVEKVWIEPNRIVNDGETIQINIIATDDRTGIKAVSCSIASPSNLQIKSGINLTQVSTNKYTATVKIPYNVESGTWTLSTITLIDCAWNLITYFNGSGYENTVFFINSKNPDISPPTFSKIKLEPFIVNDGSTITIIIEGATDDIAGIDKITCGIKSSEVEQKISNINLIQDSISGNYKANVYIPKYVKSGYWQVDYVKMQDNAWNVKTYYYGTHYTDGYFIVNSVEDVEPPKIANVTVSPIELNFGDTVKLTLNAADNKSKVIKIEATFLSPTGKQIITLPFTYDESLNLYVLDFRIESYLETGIWKASTITVEDEVGNKKIYYHGRDYHVAFLVGANLISTTDLSKEEIPPGVVVLGIPANISDGEVITLTCSITDNLSGLAYAEAHFCSPTGKFQRTIPFVSKGNDEYYASLFVPKYVENGTWTVKHIYVIDNVQNSKYYYHGNDYQASFYVNSIPDITPPVISDIIIDKNLVDVTKEPHLVTVRCNVSDDLSGVKFVRATFLHTHLAYLFDSFSTPLIKLTDTTNTYEGKCIVPQHISSGTYTLYITAEDNIDNYHTYHSTLSLFVISSPPPPVAPMEVAPQPEIDTQPPQASDFKVSPNKVRDGETITVSCKVIDEKSGVGYVCAHIESPTGRQKYDIELFYTPLTGLYEGRLTIQKFVQLGLWKVDYIICRDIAGNSNIYYNNKDYFLEFSVGYTEDITPPKLISVEVTPQETLSGSYIKCIVKATDTLAGINYVKIALCSPTEIQQNINIELTPEKIYPEFIIFSTITYIPPEIEEGVWKIKSITTKDNALNEKTYHYPNDYTTGTFLILPLLPVQDLVAFPYGSTGVLLSWMPSISPQVDLYNIYFSSDEIDYTTPQATVKHPIKEYIATHLTPGKTYKFAVRTVALNGREEKNKNVVSVYLPEIEKSPLSPASARAIIKTPKNGKKISGNRVTIMAEIINDKEVKYVRFEYKKSSEELWQIIKSANINHPNPDTEKPYFIHWDVTNLEEGYYELRAIACDLNGNEDQSPQSITIMVDHHNPDILENISENIHKKIESVYNNQPNTIHIGEENTNKVVETILPANTFLDYKTEIQITIGQNAIAVPNHLLPLDGFIDIKTKNNQKEFLRDIKIIFPYKDEDNNGEVDGAFIDEKLIEIHSHNNNGWEKEKNYTIDTKNNQVTITTRKITTFGLFIMLNPDFSNIRLYPNPYIPNDGIDDNGKPYNLGDPLSGIILENTPNNFHLEIYTVAGELIYKKYFTSTGGKVRFDPKSDDGVPLPTGGYILLLKTQDGKITKTSKLGIIQ